MSRHSVYLFLLSVLCLPGLLLVRITLQSHVDGLVAEVDTRLQRQAHHAQEQKLYSIYGPRLDSMMVNAERSAATRLHWEASVRQLIEQQDGELTLLALETQRPLASQPAEGAYQLHETEAEVKAGVQGESSALQLLLALSRLAAYATAVNSCSINQNSGNSEKKLSKMRPENIPMPLRLTCQLFLYELSRS